VSGIVLGPALAPALTTGAISIVAFPGLSTVMGVIPMIGVLAARDYIQHDRIVARIPHERQVLTVRAKHLSDAELRVTHGGDTHLAVQHEFGWAEFEGTAAIHATGLLISGANRYGASNAHVNDAVRQIERAGDATGFLSAAATRNSWRSGRILSLVNSYRGLGAMRLSGTERLALEMAVHEENERRALEGELAVLAAAWRDAEEIAAIADDDLTPPKLYEN